MENKIIDIINKCVDKENADSTVESSWRKPVIGFAAADDPMFIQLKTLIGKHHAMPEDILHGAKSIVAYFMPFNKDIIQSNIGAIESSREWDIANIETNILLAYTNKSLVEFFKKYGCSASLLPATYKKNKMNRKINWSHRHAAYIAGVGTFGINNMLITEQGCCGRIGSVVTTMKLKPTERSGMENCLFKFNGSCEKCIDLCVAGAIAHSSCYPWVDIQKCNKQIYNGAVPHYEKGDGDACGKCMVGVPCSFINPAAKLQRLKDANTKVTYNKC